MNNNILAFVFLVAGTLLTTAVTVVPAAYAGGDDDGGDGNKNKAEDDSAAAIADCDDNEVERAGFDCIAAAVDEVGVDFDGGGGEETADFCHNPANGPPTTHLDFPQSAIDAHLAAQEAGIPGHEDDHLGACEAGET